MPQLIDIPGKGTVEFPDDMSLDDITHAIRIDELQTEREQLAANEPSQPRVYMQALGTELLGNIEQTGIGIAQGLAQLGTAANKLIEVGIAKLGGFGNNTPEEIARHESLLTQFRGATEVASESASELEQLGRETPGSTLPRRIGAGVAQSAPSIAAAPFGLSAAAIAAALQGFGSAQAQNEQLFIEQGDTPELARGKALPASLASGVITGVVTALFGRTGIESLGQSIVNGSYREVLRNILRQGGLEASEEFVDESGQLILELATLYPDKSPEEIVTRAYTALASGLVAGAGVTALGQVSVGESAPMGIVPPGAQVLPVGAAETLGAVQAASDILGEGRVQIAEKRPDVMPARDWFASPEFEFRNDAVAGPIAVAVNEAQLSFGSEVKADNVRFNELRDTMSTEERKQVTTALRAVESTGTDEAVDALPLKQQSAALEVRNYFNTMRNLVINEKVSAIRESLSPNELDAIEQIESGTPIDDVLNEPERFSDLQKLAIRESVSDLADARSWGIENYVTHIERGSLRLVTPEGGTVARARNRVEAALKADAWLASNPDVDTLTITDEFGNGSEMPTKLSRGQYFRFLNRAADELGRDAATIQEILSKAGRVVAIKPTAKYAGPMQQRRGVMKGEDDIFDVLPAYSYAMRKKLALDPVFRQARTALGSMPENTRSQIEALLDDARGRKTVGDRIVDYVLSPAEDASKWRQLLAPAPFAYSRGGNQARNVNTWLKLGYRPVAAAVNRISGAMHTWVKTGTDSFRGGRAFIKTPEGKAILDRNAARIGMDASFATEGGADEAPRWWHPMRLFHAAEEINRPEAFGAFYMHATSKLGLEGAEAEAWARAATRFAQFTYNSAALPRAMRGPTGRLLLQFKPYLVKELEYISTLRGAEIPRYIAASLAIGGPRAALYTLMSLPLLGALGKLDDLEDWLNRNAPRASRGLPGFAGVDVSPAVAFQFPQTGADWFGPVVADIARLWTDVLGPVIEGKERNMGDVGEWASRIAPAWFWWQQALESLMDDTGWTTDKYGNLSFKPTNADRVKMLMGAKPLTKSLQEVETRYLRTTEAIQREDRQRSIEAFLDALKEKDGVAADKLADRLAEMGVTAASVQRAARNRGIEPRDRLLRSLSRFRRGQEAERFSEPTEATPTP